MTVAMNKIIKIPGSHLPQSQGQSKYRQGSTLAVFRYPEHPRFSDGIPDSPAQ